MAWVIPTLTGIMNIMETVMFLEFIEEEAIQSAALGVFLAIRQRNYSQAWRAINLLQNQLLPHLEALITHIGWLCPYSIGVFSDFWLASKTNVEIYIELCMKAPKS
jgi:hypothetical protein